MEKLKMDYLEKVKLNVTNRNKVKLKIRNYEARNEAIEEKIRELKNELKTTYKYPNWVDEIVKPLAKELKEKTNAVEYEVRGPFGEGEHVSIHLYLDEGKTKTIGITLEQGDLSKGIILYLTDKRISGHLNEFNFIKKELPNNIDDIVKILFEGNLKQ